jgi:hypothetical protein
MDFETCFHLFHGFDPEWLTGIGECTTALAVIVGGILGLQQYKEGHRLRAADMLVEMEKEYRAVLPVCIEFEIAKTYDKLIKPMLLEIQKSKLEHADLTDLQVEKLKELDRAIRFFYACSVLNGELRVEENVIGRVYYYYLSILADPGQGKELYTYVQVYYPRLHNWLQTHRKYLSCYRKTGTWAEQCE